MDKDHVKRAFRQAFEFANANLTERDLSKIAGSMAKESDKCGGDSLTMRLVFAVYDYIGAELERGNT